MAKALAALIIVAALSASQAEAAGFVTNKEGWERLTSTERYWYAAGAYDEMVTVSTEDRQPIVDIKLALIRCARDQDMSVATMSRFVTTGYQDPTRWAYPASAMLYAELLKACSVYLPSKGGKP